MPIRVQVQGHGIVEFPDGTTEEQMAAALRTLPQSKPQATEPSAVDSFLADNPALPLSVRAGQAIARFAKAKPVTAGAVAGGLATAPLTGGASIPAAMAAAGLGAAGGAGVGLAAEQLATGRPRTAGDVVGTMAKEGAIGAAGQGIGSALTTIAGKFAPVLARAVLKPSKALQQEHGADELVGSFLKERVPVGRSGEIATRTKASAAAADQMIAQAQQAGAPPVTVGPVATQMRPVIDKANLRVRLGQPDEAPALVDRVLRMRAANPGGIPLVEAQAMKREAQTMAHRGFRAADAGNVINDIGAHADKAVATGLKTGIEARVPGVKAVNANTQRLMGLEEALADAETKNPGLVGINPLQWLGSMTPGFGSKAAFLADTASRMPAGSLLQAALLGLLSPDAPKNQP